MAFHCIYSPCYGVYSPSRALLILFYFSHLSRSFCFSCIFLLGSSSALTSKKNHLCLIYSQRLPIDYENCDNLADYLSLQRAAQAQTQDTIPTTQQRMSLLKFLAIVSSTPFPALFATPFLILPWYLWALRWSSCIKRFLLVTNLRQWAN